MTIKTKKEILKGYIHVTYYSDECIGCAEKFCYSEDYEEDELNTLLNDMYKSNWQEAQIGDTVGLVCPTCIKQANK